jgi:hypothetical protein
MTLSLIINIDFDVVSYLFQNNVHEEFSEARKADQK